MIILLTVDDVVAVEVTVVGGFVEVLVKVVGWNYFLV